MSKLLFGVLPLSRRGESDGMCIYPILINWNDWKNTIERLESVFSLKCHGYRVVVCDSASADGSFARIAKCVTATNSYSNSMDWVKLAKRNCSRLRP
jgi:hypothetical protein